MKISYFCGVFAHEKIQKKIKKSEWVNIFVGI